MLSCGMPGIKLDEYTLRFILALDMGVEALTRDNETTVKEEQHGAE